MCENCNRIESSQCHIFFGWFSQGKSNDWKEIWLELYLEGINCQSNVPNPWPELIYLRRSGKPGRKSQIHKVHPKWGLSRGRLMIPIRELGSGIGDRIAGSGTAYEPFDRLSVSQSVNWHFSSLHPISSFSGTQTIQSNYRASSCWQFAQGDADAYPSFFTYTTQVLLQKYCFGHSSENCKNNRAQIPFATTATAFALYSWMILKSSALLSFTFPFWQIHWPYLSLYLPPFCPGWSSRRIWIWSGNSKPVLPAERNPTLWDYLWRVNIFPAHWLFRVFLLLLGVVASFLIKLWIGKDMCDVCPGIIDGQNKQLELFAKLSGQFLAKDIGIWSYHFLVSASDCSFRLIYPRKNARERLSKKISMISYDYLYYLGV